jgi:hypothetical protein
MRELNVMVTSLESSIQRSISNQTSAALGLIAAVGLPASIAFAVWSATQPKSLHSVVWPIAGTLLGALVVLVVFPGMRLLFKDAVLRRKK